MRSLKPDLLFQQNLPFLLKNTWGQTACKILAMTSLIFVGSAGAAIAQTASCVSPYNEVYGSNQPNQIWAIHGPTGAATQLTTNSSLTAINGMASDHNNFLVYYGDGNSIYAWDVLNGDHELITNNFQSFLTQAGYTGKFVTLSSGGAAFYNGSLYVGVDGDTDQDFEIFRVNFQSGSNGRTIQSVTPLEIAAKSGGNITSSTREDWGDFIISNTGVILGLTNKRNSPTQRRFWNFDLNTNTFTLRATSSTNYQLAKSGDGRLWGLGSDSTVVELNSDGSLKGSSLSTSIAASDAAECVTGQASVGDRVWSDVDSDGVQDAGELGISGVTIEIYRDLNKNGVIDSGEPLLATQTTDSNGNYNFTGLLPHDRSTGTGHNDFIVKVNGGVPAGATATTATSKTADLSSATQVFDTADFGYKLLAISGKVWDDADNSANNSFTNINTGTEAGTNAGGLNAILVNASGNVIATTPVATDGTYTFNNVTGSQNNLTIRLSTTAGTVGSAAPTASIPANWTNTSPLLTATFNIGTSNITGQNFGIEQLPDTNNVTATSQTNPGGTNTVQVSALSGTDPEDGTLGTGKTFKIVTLPTNGILYYNGTAVTVGQNITNYDPTKLTIDPNDGALTINFTYAAVDAGGKLDPTPATVTMPFSATYSISGKVWDDADNSANNSFTNINTGTEAGTNAGGLNAILVNASGNVIATTPVATDGTYTFNNVTGSQNNLTIRLSTTAGTVGSAAPTASIPANWTNTSPLLTATFNIGTSNITGQNFGIEQLPDTNNVTATSQTNPGGTNTVQVSALSGTDPEDGTLGTGKTFKIVTLPTNGTLYYNGTAVTVGQNITNYDPTKLTIDPNDGALTINFTYAAVDAGGKLDPTPATVTMPFSATYSISGKVWDDADNSANNSFTNINTGTEAGTNAGGLNAILVNASGNVIATTPVATDGTYTFNNVTGSQNNLTIRLSTTAGTVGSAAPAASIPANWTNTSPLLTATFNIGTSNITGQNFGIEQLPDTNNVTATSQTNPGGTNTVQVSALSGTDPEDGTLGTGKTFKIVTLPTNGTLYYNGTAVTVGQNITNYDPTKLTIDPNDGALTINFTYAAVDAGGKLDPTPATVTMPFSATYSISGTLYQDNDGDNTFNSEPTLPASITVKLLNASNSSVVTTTTTTTSGTYTFTGVTAGNYKVQVDTSDTDIPAGMSLGTPNDVVANVSSSNISNINFGFDIPTNPISCDGNFYQIRVAGSGSQLFKINRSVNPYTQTQIGNITPNVTLNALGYNKLDGFMYAIKSNTNQLYRIDQNGAVYLGTVTGLPAADYNTATIDSAGNYYVKVGTLNSTIYKINVSTRTTTTITLDQSINLGDMAFHPTNGAIYGLRDATLYKIVISGTSGTVTTIGNTNISGSPAVGSVFFDASGSLYGYENAGTFYSINTTTGNATLVSTAPATSQSDGASCAFTSPERVISTVKSVGTVLKVNNTTFNVPYTIVVTNTGTDTAPNTQITENLNLTFSTGSPTLTIPSSPTVTNGSCTANTGFNGTTDTKLLTGSNTLPIGASGTCTIKFTVQVVYPNQASVPSAAQNNTAYASITFDSPNPGYTFASGTPIPPPALLASAQSTVSATYPATTNVANVLLVKRITAINSDRTKNPNDNTPLNLFVDDTTSTRKDDDNDPMWKSGYLLGAIDAGKVKPGDEIEYTVYFLNAGGANANSVRLCDRITANQDFKVNAYGTSKDLQLQLGTSTVLDLTSASDASDRTQLVSAGGTVPSNCYLKAANDNGTLVIDITGNANTGVPNLTALPGSTAQATPNDSYGFFRFITKVKP